MYIYIRQIEVDFQGGPKSEIVKKREYNTNLRALKNHHLAYIYIRGIEGGPEGRSEIGKVNMRLAAGISRFQSSQVLYRSSKSMVETKIGKSANEKKREYNTNFESP